MSWYAPAQAGGSFTWRSSSIYSSRPSAQPQPQPEKPAVLAISRDDRLSLDRLGHQVTLHNIKFRDGTQIMQELQLGHSRPAAVLMLDPDIYQPQEGCLGRLMSGWLKNYVNNGGTLESRTQYMNDWMRDTWNLRWWLGTSRDTPMMRTSEAVGRTRESTELWSLPSQWDSSFRCLTNVAPAHG